jgi:predicted kinase
MRKLLLVRGIPGSGKSTYIREHGLEPYTLSADTLRMVYAGPVLDATGRMRIPADNDRDVWQKLYELLEQRMRNGELIIVDATHAHPRSFTNYTELVNRYRYQVVLVDFATVPFET